MRIVFMGTPDFAVASLKTLQQAGEEIVGVVTAPDKRAGRGRKMNQSAVKRYASENGLRVLQPTNLKSEAFLEELRALRPDLIVVVAFRMLPKQVWDLPQHGTINLHASLLPQYRGAAPINWAIINGEEKTGVTTFFINENIDTGDLIMQVEVEIGPEDTAGELHDKLMIRGANLLVESVKSIEKGEVPRQKQAESKELKPAPKIQKEDTHINFDQAGKKVFDFIRGLSPYPAAYALLQQNSEEKPVKIFEVELIPGEPTIAPGAIDTDNRSYLKIACRDTWISVKSLQIAGKKRMSISELLNGFQLEKTAKFA